MVRERPPSDPAQGPEASGVSVVVATTRGNWGEVWVSFDRRAQAKASNDVVAVEDMLARAGVAAE